jgi:hypothetical protein
MLTLLHFHISYRGAQLQGTGYSAGRGNAPCLRHYDSCYEIKMMWRMHSLLGRGFEIDETTAFAMQERGKHASTTIELLLETVSFNPLLGSCNNWPTTMEIGVFSSWFVPRSYLEDNWGYPRSCQFTWKPVKRRLGGWCEMAASLGGSQLSEEFCLGCCEVRTWACETLKSSLLEAVARERPVKTQQADKKASGCCGDL